VCFLSSSLLDEHDKNWAWNNFLSQRALQQADNVRQQLKRSMEKHDLDLVSTPFEDKSYYTNIRKALASGFFMQVAHQEGGKGNYLTIKDNQVGVLSPLDVLPALWPYLTPPSPKAECLSVSFCTYLFRSSSFTRLAVSIPRLNGSSSTSLFSLPPT
jgi:HrpA-like RNA helicase